MRHQSKKSRLNRAPNHRNAMLRNMAASLVLYEKIETTESKAKLLKPMVDRLIATAKRQDKVNAMRTLNAVFYDQNATKKLMEEILKRYEGRTSGFVRVTPLGYRAGDAAPIVQVELV